MMMMKRYLIIMLLFAMPASAADLKFSWTNPVENTGKVDGTKIYMDTSEVGAVATVGPTVVTATAPMPTDGKCHSFWARAYKGTLESGNSDVVAWCPSVADPPPATQPPTNIGGFKITTTVTPIQ